MGHLDDALALDATGQAELVRRGEVTPGELVGAAIDARCRDGKSSTLRGAVPAFAGYDGTQAVYATGASAQALTVSSDDLTGNLSNAAGTELTSAAASSGVGVLVIVDRA